MIRLSRSPRTNPFAMFPRWTVTTRLIQSDKPISRRRHLVTTTQWSSTYRSMKRNAGMADISRKFQRLAAAVSRMTKGKEGRCSCLLSSRAFRSEAILDVCADVGRRRGGQAGSSSSRKPPLAWVYLFHDSALRRSIPFECKSFLDPNCTGGRGCVCVEVYSAL